MDIAKQIKGEVTDYISKTVDIADGVSFSEYKLKKRINYFKNRYYPTGKVTPQGEYEYWFDVIYPRVNNEIKNLRLDTKHILLFSKNPVVDFAAVYIANAGLFEWMWENGKAEELKDAVEMFSSDGNVLFRRTSDGYELWDPDNTFLTNTTAKTVNETAIIERFYMTQSQLRAKEGVYKNVEEVIKSCGGKVFKKDEQTTPEQTTSPMYELYRRTGEISEAQLLKAQGKKGGSEDKFVLARVIVAGIGAGKGGEFVLFAEPFKAGETMSNYYKEAHRGPYKGRWWREGLYELLFDHQVRGNEIGTQIARGLEWAGKILFRHTDVQTLQNVRTALNNGSLIKSADISQIEVRLQGFDQLVADWNRVNEEADKIANSYEVIQGNSLPSQTPFGLGRLMDSNANKLFALLRQKLSIPYKRVFKEFVLPQLVKDIKGKDIVRLTGDARFIEEFYKLAANGWYLSNLAKIGPHTPEIAEKLKAAKVAELQNYEPLIKNTSEIWKGVLPRIYVTITGENYAIEEQETIATMLQFEQDPNRRAYLLDYIYRSKGVPVPPVVQQQVVEPQGARPPAGEPELPQPGASTPEPVSA